MNNGLFATVKFTKNHPDAQTPFCAHQGDAGYDLYSVEDLWVRPGSIIKVATGISIELPPYTYGHIVDRSSMGLKGLHVFSGVIDNGFSGSLSVILFNACATTDSLTVYHIKKGDRVAQLIVKPVYEVTWEETPSLNTRVAPRGTSGFGSSGR